MPMKVMDPEERLGVVAIKRLGSASPRRQRLLPKGRMDKFGSCTPANAFQASELASSKQGLTVLLGICLVPFSF